MIKKKSPRLLFTHFEVPPVYPEGSFREVIGSNKLEVEGPDTVVLGEGQRPEGAVECSPGASDLTLLHEKLAVVYPYTRHLGVGIN